MLLLNTPFDIIFSSNFLKHKNLRLVFLVVVLVFSGLAGWGQTTDDYRTRQSGYWDQLTTWERYNGTTWQILTGANPLTLPASGDNVITIRNGHAVSVTANVTVDQVIVDAGGQIVINDPRTLRIANGSGIDLDVSGTLETRSTAGNAAGNIGGIRVNSGASISFNSGGTYVHNVNGEGIPNATWNAGSLLKITGITNTLVTLPQAVGGSVEWNCPNQNVSGDIYNSVSGGATFSIGEDFDIVNTNTGTIFLFDLDGQILNVGGNLSQSGNLTIESNGTNDNQTLNIGGNFSLNSGILNLSSNTGNTIIINVTGNWIQTGGTLTETSSSTGNINFNGGATQTYSKSGGTISNTINFSVVVGSTLDVGTSLIDGSTGTFTLNSGAGIITAHAQGLSTTAGTGSIQVTGTKTYNTGANYTYNGSTAQVTGNGLTGAANLTINNSSRVTLSAATTVSGIVTLTNGILTTSTVNTLRVFNNSTSAIAGASTDRFIDGPLRWTLASGSSYTFPVGDGSTYLPFGLNVSAGTAPQITVEAINGNSSGTALSPLGTLSTTEYWLAQISGGTYSNGSVSLARQSTLTGLDAVGRSATLSGNYSNLNGTVSGTSIINSDNTGNSLGYFVMAAKRSITVGTISPTSYCPGSPINIPYTITGTFNSGNVFTAQLSDGAGSFASPVIIGTITSTASGTISATLPVSAEGTGYRVRVVSNSPLVTSADNGVDISIGSPQIVTSPGSQCRYTDNVDVTISASSSLTGTFRWYDSGYTLLDTENSVNASSFIANDISITTTYYVTFESGGCTTPFTEIKAYVIEPPSLDASAGGSFCSGTDINLYSDGSYDNLYWDGPNGFYSTSEDPVITNASTGMSGTYTVHTNTLSGVNLVYNGNFELGNVGFETDYTLDEVYVHPEGKYAIVNDPNSVHPGFTNCPPVSGDLQMVINGSTDINIPVIWRQTVNVVPGTDYQFTYWVQSVVASNPSVLQLYVNDVEAGPEYVAETATCIWKQFLYNWSSGTATTAKLELRNKNTIAGGNDFALDSLVFQHTCTSNASVEVFVSNLFTPSVSIAASPSNMVCSGQQVTFTATPTHGGAIPSYQWKINGTNAGSNNSTFTYSPVDSEIVTCVMTSDLSCVTSPTATSNAITMTVYPTPVATISGNAAICNGASTTLSVDFTGTGPWEITTQRNGTEPVTVTNISVNPYTFDVSAAGTYTISAFNDAVCTGTASGSAVVTVIPLPTAGISDNNSPLCAGDNAIFTLIGTTGAVVTYNVNSGSNQTVTLTSGTATITISNAPDDQTLTLVSVTDGTCSQTLSAGSTITVNPLPVVGSFN